MSFSFHPKAFYPKSLQCLEVPECSPLLFLKIYLLKGDLNPSFLVTWRFHKKPSTAIHRPIRDSENRANAHDMQVFFFTLLIGGKPKTWVTGHYILVFQSICHLMNIYLGPVRNRVLVNFQWNSLDSSWEQSHGWAGKSLSGALTVTSRVCASAHCSYSRSSTVAAY